MEQTRRRFDGCCSL
uniref:Uncharacterized protein n=1 Tax=Arundo donax TaxID=35708 RepID=A0A0A9GTE0_ARUDO